MNNKKVKKFVSCVCALTLLLGAIPMNSIKAEAEENTMETVGGVEFYDATGAKKEDAQFSLHGVSYDAEEGIFVRMDAETAAEIAGTNSLYDDKKGNWINTVYSLARETAGGRIRFNTNSTTIKIEAELYQWDASHVSHAASMEGGKYGFDVYVDTANGSSYVDTAIAVTDADGNNKIDPGSVFVNKTITLGEAGNRDVTIYFPITIEVKNVKITVDEGSTVQNHQKGYDGNGRLVFYGSSITQGGCATKPGNTYVNTVGRNLNMEYIDFGMWGRCKGEPAFAEYIAGLGNISAFVYDFDHNISKVAQMEPVHYPFYEVIREAYPDIPIIMMTRPGNGLDTTRVEEPEKGYSTVAEMKEVIRASYEKAKANGDENVHFVDGESFFNYSKGYMRDNAHPNDAGQGKMAEVVTAVLEKAFAGEKNICVEPQTDCKEEKLNEDFEDGATGWTAKKSAVDSFNFKTVADENENNVYQLQYTRGSKTPTGYLGYTESDILSGLSNFSVEMDATVHKITSDAGDKWSYLGLWLVDEVDSKKYRYDIQIIPATEGCRVEFKDRSDASSTGQEFTEIVEDSQLAVSDTDTKVSYHLRADVDTFIDNSGTKWVIVSVYINDNDAIAFKFQPLKQDFEPKTIRTYLYSGAIAGVYTATIDNVKVYNMGHKLSSVAEVPSTGEVAGTKAHYVCDLCGKKFLDADGIIPVSDADLVLAKGCTWFSEDFENGASKWEASEKNYSGTETFGIVSEGENSVYQLLVTRASSNVSNYIYTNTPVLEGHSDYTMNLHGELYKADNGRWPVLSLMLKDRDSGYYEIQFTPRSEGCKITLKEKTGDAAAVSSEKTIEDKTISVSSKTKVSYDIQVVVDTYTANDGTTKVKFTVGIGESETVEFDITPNNQECTPTQLRVFLYSGSLVSNQPEEFKGTVDNIQLHQRTHTIKKVEKVESTEETAGTKEHYACKDCGKKFANSTGTQEVTEADLQYAALPEIKCQTRENDRGLTDIRFVAYVDDYKQYQSVTFKITLTANGKSGTAECKTVYKTIIADDIRYTTEDIYGADGYFAAFKLLNNTTANLAEEMKVDVTWKDLAGNEKTSTRTITVSQEMR